MTVGALESEITRLLGEKYLVSPQVTVFVKEFSNVFVFGEVENPGSFPIFGRMTVFEAITIAGGFTDVANKSKVKVVRQQDGGEAAIVVDIDQLTEKGDQSQDVELRANDRVIVTRSFFKELMKPPVTHEEVHLRDYLYILKKRRFVIVFFTLLVLSAGIAFTYMENVVYKATTTILIERENPNVVDFKEVMAVDGSSSDYYQTQYQMLQSRTLIERLIREENLENDSYLAGARKGKMRLLLRKYQQYLPEWFEGFCQIAHWQTFLLRECFESTLQEIHDS